MGYFGGWLGLDETNHLRVGESVVIAWKKADGSALGGSEGLLVGLFGDDTLGKFVVLDRSCYKDSFKASVFALGIHDLKVIPFQDIASVERRQLRERPPNFPERFSFLLDAFYYSNIDYQATLSFIQEREDFTFNLIGNDRAEYGIGIKNIHSIKDASINITCKGIVQITCQQKNLDNCIEWLNKAIKILPDHKRLVLFPKSISYRLSDTFVEKSSPSEEITKKIALEEGSPIIMPLGWRQNFLAELDENPLTGLFSDSEQTRSVITDKEKIENDSTKQEQSNFQKSGVTVEKYLGNKSPLLHIEGEILSPKDEEGLMKMWSNSRSDVWRWFDSGPMKGGQVKGKVLIHDLTIDRKAGTYTVDIRTYSGNQFTSEKRDQ